jgi:hypothetical protein
MIAYGIKHDIEFTIPATTNDAFWNPIYFPHLINPDYNPSLPNILIQERQHSYHEIEFHETWRDVNITLEGYWQSYKYFDFCIDKVRELFRLKCDSVEDVCGLHIRRGDFLLYPDKHILPPDEYYETATNIIRERTGIKKILVVSDDIPFCKNYFTEGRFGFEYEFSEGRDELQDFEVLMNCRAIITAASTFSGLAATLNPNPNRVIVCPHEDNFFGKQGRGLDLSTMYPPDFIKIKY